MSRDLYVAVSLCTVLRDLYVAARLEFGSVFGVKFLLVSLFWPGSISHSGLI